MYQRKSDGLWCEKLPNGKVIAAKTKKRLIEKLTSYKDDAEKGLRFDVAADQWEEYHAAQCSYKTIETYRPAIRRAKEYFDGMYLKDITANNVNAFVLYIASKGYSRRSVQLHLDCVRMIFNYAIIQPRSVVTANPCAAVSIPKGLAKSRREPPTDAELSVISADCEMGLFATFLLYTGLRKGELLALQWRDVDRANKVIHVYKSVYYESNQPLIKAPKTEAGTRDVDLLDVLAAALPAETDPNDFIFGGKKPLTKSSFRKRWLSYCKAHNVDVTPHQFRHAYASMLDDAGIDETTAMNLLGHSSIQVTKDVYTHLRQNKKQRAINQLNDYISTTLKPATY